jgi:hypothetical protein
MRDNPSQEHHPRSAWTETAWGPRLHCDPVQEYQMLAHELHESFPGIDVQQLDRMIAREMALYGGYSAETIQHAMRQASCALAAGHVCDVDRYIARTVAEAMQPDPTDDLAFGWGV